MWIIVVCKVFLVMVYKQWRCWSGHLTHKIVLEMTYDVSSVTLNPSIPRWPRENFTVHSTEFLARSGA